MAARTCERFEVNLREKTATLCSAIEMSWEAMGACQGRKPTGSLPLDEAVSPGDLPQRIAQVSSIANDSRWRTEPEKLGEECANLTRNAFCTFSPGAYLINYHLTLLCYGGEPRAGRFHSKHGKMMQFSSSARSWAPDPYDRQHENDYQVLNKTETSKNWFGEREPPETGHKPNSPSLPRPTTGAHLEQTSSLRLKGTSWLWDRAALPPNCADCCLGLKNTEVP